MKKRHLFGLFLFVLIFAAFSGCATQEPITVTKEVEVVKETFVPVPPETLVPLTPLILQRIGESSENLADSIKQYQLILAGRVSMELEYTVTNDTREKGGKASFEDVHIRDVIIINDQTEGIAASMESLNSGEYTISVFFESDNNHTLTFSNMPGETEPYLYLNYHLNGSFSNDEKGTIKYGGSSYKLKYSGEKKPYLLIKLSQKDTDRLNSRTASGRKIIE